MLIKEFKEEVKKLSDKYDFSVNKELEADESYNDIVKKLGMNQLNK